MQNRLAKEPSLYLRQHADNPVDWHPWGTDALESARQQNKPILLSIGYSACHWCHVMAHESFEDEETAKLMNTLFINIKVDREERPDLDKIYQLAHYAITQRGGGWPLTMFLTPEQIPIFGGTYFPKEPRYGLPGFKDILQRIAAYIQEHPADLRQQSENFSRFLHNLQHTNPQPEQAPGEHLLVAANNSLLKFFDAENGGFGDAPKFPHSSSLNYALRQTQRHETGTDVRAELSRLVHHSLNKMAKGGIRDQLGGGFFRYSVDAEWSIPHFEKMLYDNALLLDLYTSAWQAQASPLYTDVITETANWVIQEMQSPQGGYYATLDADSEGVEGKYYVWDRANAESLLSEPTYRIFAEVYGLNKPPNFEEHWHLHIQREPETAATELGMNAALAQQQLSDARNLLMNERHKRVRPGRDEKILTSWNALMLKAMFRAGQAFNQQEWIDSAEDALAFLRNSLWDGGKLFAVHAGGTARYPAYLDDYVFLLDAVLTALQCRWRNEDLAFAEQLADILLNHFEDADNGGFYFTADNHEALIYRPRTKSDESTPAGAAVAACVLQRLWQLTDDENYRESAERCLYSAAADMQAAPVEHCAFLTALEEQLSPSCRIILRGELPELQEWQTQLARLYLPASAVYAIGLNEEAPPQMLALPEPDNGGVTAYLCQSTTCSPPIDTIEGLLERLKK